MSDITKKNSVDVEIGGDGEIQGRWTSVASLYPDYQFPYM